MGTWTSPTKGPMTIDEILVDMMNYIEEDKQQEYELRVGTDSQRGGRSYVFVTSIIIRRVGKGGRFFYKKKYISKKLSLEERMWEEATTSLQVAEELAKKVIEKKLPSLQMCLDLDLGTNGKTKSFIKAITGMISSYGFTPDIKPNSYAASSVSDKFAR